MKRYQLANLDAASMIPAVSPPPRRHQAAVPSTEVAAHPGGPRVAYGRPFWLAYVSNSLVMVAVSLLFRYADFVTLLGGTEFHLGWIVGVGMVGSLFTRLALGSSIDRYGTKAIWIGSTLLFSAVCFAHLAVTSHTGVAIYVLRILLCCAIAGIYGSSMTFVSSRGPSERMAELIGMLGTAGFLGTVVGTALGDVLLRSVTAEPTHVARMFIAAGLIELLSLPFVWLATRSEVPPAIEARLPVLDLLRRHHPGVVLVVGVAMGMGLGLPNTFLRTYAAELQIPRISLFFTVYAAAAIVTRVLTRRWPARFGTRPMILLGLAGMVASMALFLLVRAEWQLAWPALGFGCAHAVLFPSVVAAGSITFPVQHRGLATLLVLAAWDMGQLIGAPAAGAVLRYSESAGLRPYPTMFVTMAVLLSLVAVWYSIASRGRTDAAEVAATLESQ